MNSLKKYSSFIKLEHTLFSLPLFFAGALFAENEWPGLRTTVLIVLAGGSARIVALALNRIIDRHVDRQNPRTQARPLSTGAMSSGEAWLVALIGLAIYLFSAWLISGFCLTLSWIPLVGFAAYPYFKRFTKWAHLGLGLVWALVPLAGFFAVKPSFEGVLPAATLALFTVFWLAGFDIIYATSDEEFDREAGLYSLPACWGAAKALGVAALFHWLAFLCLVVIYSVWLSGPVTVMLLVTIGILLFLEQKFSHYVDAAFFQMNVFVGFAVLFFILTGVKGV